MQQNEDQQGALEAIARDATARGAARVEVVGRWVWAWFASKPPYEVRRAMSAAGFHWNKKRACWQFAGVPSFASDASAEELREKYQARAVG